MFKSIYSLENVCGGVFLRTAAGVRAYSFIKEDSSQMLSCKTYEVLQNIAFKKTLGRLLLDDCNLKCTHKWYLKCNLSAT